MGSPIFRRGRALPAGVPQIDWSNPLTNGMVSFVIPSLQFDLVRGKSTAKVSTPTPAISPAGYGISATSAKYITTAPKLGLSSQSFTWEAFFHITTMTAPCGVFGETVGWGIGLVGNFGSLMSFTLHGSGGFSTLNGTHTYAVGELRHLVGTCDGTNMRVYENGILVAGPTAHTSGTIDSIATLAIGSTPGATDSSTKTVLCARYWQRALSAPEIADLSANPWTMAIYPSDRGRRVGSSGPPPTFVSAWVMGSNLPVIGTGTY